MPNLIPTTLANIPLNTPTFVKMSPCQENNAIVLTKQSDDGMSSVILLNDTLQGISHTETRLSSTIMYVMS